MRVSIALLIAASVAPVLAVPAFDLGASNAMVNRDAAPVDAVDLLKREISLGNVYARGDISQLSQLTGQASALGLLNPSQASSLLGNFGGASDPMTSMMTTAMSQLMKAYGTGAISQGQASSLLAPFTASGLSSNAAGSSGGSSGAGGLGELGGLVTGLLSTVLGLVGGGGL